MRLILAVAFAFLTLSPTIAAEISGRATVVDGDTIAVEGTEERIRLYGIDTPEGKQTCDDAAGKRYLCGSRAADHLAGLIGRNGRVSCVEEDRDRYGRIVADCTTAKGVSLNAEMVRAGWAIEYDRYSDGRFSQAEDEARSSKRGMWSGSFVEPARWRKGERTSSSLLMTPIPDLGAGTRLAARQSCKVASTCREAVQMWCDGYSGADRDNDGIPCESVCRSKAQVDEIKAEIGC